MNIAIGRLGAVLTCLAALGAVAPTAAAAPAVAPASAFTKTAPAPETDVLPANARLSWQAVPGATSYEYCIDTLDDQTCNGPWVSTGTETSVLPRNVEQGFDYHWQVRAVTAADTTYADDGAWWSFRTPPPPMPFAKDPVVEERAEETVFRWFPALFADRYEVCIDTRHNRRCDGAWIPAGSATELTVGRLPGGTRYSWEVRAVNAWGSTLANDGLWSVYRTPPAPRAAAKMLPRAGTSVDAGAAVLRWRPSPYATDYAYCIDTTDNGVCDTEWHAVGMSFGATPGGLVPGTTYFWQVRASNASGGVEANRGAWWRFST